MKEGFLKNKLVTASLSLSYFLAVVLPHEEVGKMINSFFSNYSRSTYNLVISLIVLTLSAILFWILLPSLRCHREPKKMYGYLVVSAVLVFLCFNVLFVVNVEAVHFIQYAILAILLFPLSRSCSVTMSLAVLAGGLDELYQYLVLDNTNFYYDFNDVLLDTIGAGMGLLVLKIRHAETVAYSHQWYKHPGFLLSVGIASVLLVAGLLGHFSINTRPLDPAFFTLFKKAPDGFWHFPPGPIVKFHILRPVPGLIIIYATAYFYSLLDRIEPRI